MGNRPPPPPPKQQTGTVTPTVVPKQDLTFTFLILGDFGVGKTTIISTYLAKQKTGTQEQKILEHSKGQVKADGRNVKVVIWDPLTAQSAPIESAFWRVTDKVTQSSVILAFDVTNVESFNNLDAYLGLLGKFGAEGLIIYLVANKCDKENRKVSDEQIQNFLVEKKKGYPTTGHNILNYFELTGSDSQKVNSFFDKLVHHLVEKNPKQ